MAKVKLQKHTLHLRAGDMDFIKSITDERKAAALIRKLVSKFVDEVNSATPSDPVDLKDDVL